MTFEQAVAVLLCTSSDVTIADQKNYELRRQAKRVILPLYNELSRKWDIENVEREIAARQAELEVLKREKE